MNEDDDIFQPRRLEDRNKILKERRKKVIEKLKELKSDEITFSFVQEEREFFKTKYFKNSIIDIIVDSDINLDSIQTEMKIIHKTYTFFYEQK